MARPHVLTRAAQSLRHKLGPVALYKAPCTIDCVSYSKMQIRLHSSYH